MNKIIISGRLVRDAELSYIASTSTTKRNFSIGEERNYQKDKNNKKVDFINCEMIGKHTENLTEVIRTTAPAIWNSELNKYDFVKYKENDILEILLVESGVCVQDYIPEYEQEE